MQVELVPNAGWDERILVAQLGSLVQSFIVVTQRYNVLVDTMVNEETAFQLVELARAHGPGRELLVVNTHADWDHYWGNQIFRCPIIGHRLAAERAVDAEAQADLAAHAAEDPDSYARVRLTPPNVLFHDRLTIDGGDLTLELFPTPGHQPDHIGVYLPEVKTLLAGDAAEDPFPLVGSRGDLTTLRATLKAMADLRPRHALYCHAPVDIGPRLLASNRAHFELMERRCRQRRGAPPEQVYPYAEAVGEREGLPAFYAESHLKALNEMILATTR